MEEDDVVVVSSDSEEDEETIWTRKCNNKQYLSLLEKIKPILYYQTLPGYKLTSTFSYARFQEFADDLKKSVALVNVKSTQAFIWKNVIRWMLSIKLCYESVSDIINDKNYNIILADVMAQYVNYKCQLYFSLTDEAEVNRIVDEILVNLGLVFSGWMPGILMTLLKIKVIDDYRLILYPIFSKCLSQKNLHETNDLISYLRLILCYRQWKKLAHLKEDKEIINEIAVGKSAKALKSEIIDLDSDIVNKEPVLPLNVPPVNENNRAFVNITGLIGFALKNQAYGTRILLINKTLELDDTIEEFFKQYKEYINRSTPKLLEWPRTQLQPTLIEDLTRSPSPDRLLPSTSLANEPDSENKINSNNKNNEKQGTKAVNQHLSNNCDISSINVNNMFNDLNLSSNNNENLSPSSKEKLYNRNSYVEISLRKNNIVELDDDNSETDTTLSDENSTNKQGNTFEKRLAKVLQKLKEHAVDIGALVNRVNVERIDDPVIASISSDEDEQSVADVKLPPETPISVSVRPPSAASPQANPFALVEKPIRRANMPHCVPGIVSSTTSNIPEVESSDGCNLPESIRDVGNQSGTIPNLLSNDVHSDVSDEDISNSFSNSKLTSRKNCIGKVVEEATSSTTELQTSSKNIIFSVTPRKRILNSPHPINPSSQSPDRYAIISPSSTIRTVNRRPSNTSHQSILAESDIGVVERLNNVINEEQPTCSRYVKMLALEINSNDTKEKDKQSVSDDCLNNLRKTEKELKLVSNPLESVSAAQKSKNDGETLATNETVAVAAVVKELQFCIANENSSDLILKDISSFIGDSHEEQGKENVKNKSAPDKHPSAKLLQPQTTANILEIDSDKSKLSSNLVTNELGLIKNLQNDKSANSSIELLQKQETATTFEIFFDNTKLSSGQLSTGIKQLDSIKDSDEKIHVNNSAKEKCADTCSKELLQTQETATTFEISSDNSKLSSEQLSIGVNELSSIEVSEEKDVNKSAKDTCISEKSVSAEIFKTNEPATTHEISDFVLNKLDSIEGSKNNKSEEKCTSDKFPPETYTRSQDIGKSLEITSENLKLSSKKCSLVINELSSIEGSPEVHVAPDKCHSAELFETQMTATMFEKTSKNYKSSSGQCSFKTIELQKDPNANKNGLANENKLDVVHTSLEDVRETLTLYSAHEKMKTKSLIGEPVHTVIQTETSEIFLDSKTFDLDVHSSSSLDDSIEEIESPAYEPIANENVIKKRSNEIKNEISSRNKSFDDHQYAAAKPDVEITKLKTDTQIENLDKNDTIVEDKIVVCEKNSDLKLKKQINSKNIESTCTEKNLQDDELKGKKILPTKEASIPKDVKSKSKLTVNQQLLLNKNVVMNDTILTKSQNIKRVDNIYEAGKDRDQNLNDENLDQVSQKNNVPLKVEETINIDHDYVAIGKYRDNSINNKIKAVELPAGKLENDVLKANATENEDGSNDQTNKKFELGDTKLASDKKTVIEKQGNPSENINNIIHETHQINQCFEDKKTKQDFFEKTPTTLQLQDKLKENEDQSDLDKNILEQTHIEQLTENTVEELAEIAESQSIGSAFAIATPIAVEDKLAPNIQLQTENFRIKETHHDGKKAIDDIETSSMKVVDETFKVSNTTSGGPNLSLPSKFVDESLKVQTKGEISKPKHIVSSLSSLDAIKDSLQSKLESSTVDMAQPSFSLVAETKEISNEKDPGTVEQDSNSVKTNLSTDDTEATEKASISKTSSNKKQKLEKKLKKAKNADKETVIQDLEISSKAKVAKKKNSFKKLEEQKTTTLKGNDKEDRPEKPAKCINDKTKNVIEKELDKQQNEKGIPLLNVDSVSKKTKRKGGKIRKDDINKSQDIISEEIPTVPSDDQKTKAFKKDTNEMENSNTLQTVQSKSNEKSHDIQSKKISTVPSDKKKIKKVNNDIENSNVRPQILSKAINDNTDKSLDVISNDLSTLPSNDRKTKASKKETNEIGNSNTSPSVQSKDIIDDIEKSNDIQSKKISIVPSDKKKIKPLKKVTKEIENCNVPTQIQLMAIKNDTDKSHDIISNESSTVSSIDRKIKALKKDTNEIENSNTSSTVPSKSVIDDIKKSHDIQWKKILSLPSDKKKFKDLKKDTNEIENSSTSKTVQSKAIKDDTDKSHDIISDESSTMPSNNKKSNDLKKDTNKIENYSILQRVQSKSIIDEIKKSHDIQSKKISSDKKKIKALKKDTNEIENSSTSKTVQSKAIKDDTDKSHNIISDESSTVTSNNQKIKDLKKDINEIENSNVPAQIQFNAINDDTDISYDKISNKSSTVSSNDRKMKAMKKDTNEIENSNTSSTVQSKSIIDDITKSHEIQSKKISTLPSDKKKIKALKKDTNEIENSSTSQTVQSKAIKDDTNKSHDIIFDESSTMSSNNKKTKDLKKDTNEIENSSTSKTVQSNDIKDNTDKSHDIISDEPSTLPSNNKKTKDLKKETNEIENSSVSQTVQSKSIIDEIKKSHAIQSKKISSDKKKIKALKKGTNEIENSSTSQSKDDTEKSHDIISEELSTVPSNNQNCIVLNKVTNEVDNSNTSLTVQTKVIIDNIEKSDDIQSKNISTVPSEKKKIKTLKKDTNEIENSNISPTIQSKAIKDETDKSHDIISSESSTAPSNDRKIKALKKDTNQIENSNTSPTEKSHDIQSKKISTVPSDKKKIKTLKQDTNETDNSNVPAQIHLKTIANDTDKSNDMISDESSIVPSNKRTIKVLKKDTNEIESSNISTTVQSKSVKDDIVKSHDIMLEDISTEASEKRKIRALNKDTHEIENVNWSSSVESKVIKSVVDKLHDIRSDKTSNKKKIKKDTDARDNSNKSLTVESKAINLDIEKPHDVLPTVPSDKRKIKSLKKGKVIENSNVPATGQPKAVEDSNDKSHDTASDKTSTEASNMNETDSSDLSLTVKSKPIKDSDETSHSHTISDKISDKRNANALKKDRNETENSNVPEKVKSKKSLNPLFQKEHIKEVCIETKESEFKSKLTDKVCSSFEANEKVSDDTNYPKPRPNEENDFIPNIVQCKKKLVEDRNREVFSQIATEKLVKRKLQIEKDLERTEYSKDEDESNLSTQVAISDLLLESENLKENAEDQEVLEITSQEVYNSSYDFYNDENGTPVMDEKNSTDVESPSTSQSKIISLSAIKLPTTDVLEKPTDTFQHNVSRSSSKLTEADPPENSSCNFLPLIDSNRQSSLSEEHQDGFYNAVVLRPISVNKNKDNVLTSEESQFVEPNPEQPKPNYVSEHIKVQEIDLNSRNATMEPNAIEVADDNKQQLQNPLISMISQDISNVEKQNICHNQSTKDVEKPHFVEPNPEQPKSNYVSGHIKVQDIDFNSRNDTMDSKEIQVPDNSQNIDNAEKQSISQQLSTKDVEQLYQHLPAQNSPLNLITNYVIPFDEKPLNKDDLNAAAILNSLRSKKPNDNKEKPATKNRKIQNQIPATRLTRSTSLASKESLNKKIQSNIFKAIEKISTPSETHSSNVSSDSDDSRKLVIDFDVTNKPKTRKQNRGKGNTVCKATLKRKQKIAQDVPIPEPSPPAANSCVKTTKAKKTRKSNKKNETIIEPLEESKIDVETENLVENSSFQIPSPDNVTETQTNKVRPKERLSFSIDSILGNPEESTYTEEPSSKLAEFDSKQNISNKETYLNKLSLEKTRKSFDEVKSLSSETNLMQDDHVDFPKIKEQQKQPIENRTKIVAAETNKNQTDPKSKHASNEEKNVLDQSKPTLHLTETPSDDSDIKYNKETLITQQEQKDAENIETSNKSIKLNKKQKRNKVSSKKQDPTLCTVLNEEDKQICDETQKECVKVSNEVVELPKEEKSYAHENPTVEEECVKVSKEVVELPNGEKSYFHENPTVNPIGLKDNLDKKAIPKKLKKVRFLIENDLPSDEETSRISKLKTNEKKPKKKEKYPKNILSAGRKDTNKLIGCQDTLELPLLNDDSKATQSKVISSKRKRKSKCKSLKIKNDPPRGPEMFIEEKPRFKMSPCKIRVKRLPSALTCPCSTDENVTPKKDQTNPIYPDQDSESAAILTPTKNEDEVKRVLDKCILSILPNLIDEDKQLIQVPTVEEMDLGGRKEFLSEVNNSALNVLSNTQNLSQTFDCKDNSFSLKNSADYATTDGNKEKDEPIETELVLPNKIGFQNLTVDKPTDFVDKPTDSIGLPLPETDNEIVVLEGKAIDPFGDKKFVTEKHNYQKEEDNQSIKEFVSMETKQTIKNNFEGIQEFPSQIENSTLGGLSNTQSLSQTFDCKENAQDNQEKGEAMETELVLPDKIGFPNLTVIKPKNLVTETTDSISFPHLEIDNKIVVPKATAIDSIGDENHVREELNNKKEEENRSIQDPVSIKTKQIVDCPFKTENSTIGVLSILSKTQNTSQILDCKENALDIKGIGYPTIIDAPENNECVSTQSVLDFQSVTVLKPTDVVTSDLPQFATVYKKIGLEGTTIKYKRPSLDDIQNINFAVFPRRRSNSTSDINNTLVYEGIREDNHQPSQEKMFNKKEHQHKKHANESFESKDPASTNNSVSGLGLEEWELEDVYLERQTNSTTNSDNSDGKKTVKWSDNKKTRDGMISGNGEEDNEDKLTQLVLAGNVEQDDVDNTTLTSENTLELPFVPGLDDLFASLGNIQGQEGSCSAIIENNAPHIKSVEIKNTESAVFKKPCLQSENEIAFEQDGVQSQEDVIGFDFFFYETLPPTLINENEQNNSGYKNISSVSLDDKPTLPEILVDGDEATIGNKTDDNCVETLLDAFSTRTSSVDIDVIKTRTNIAENKTQIPEVDKSEEHSNNIPTENKKESFKSKKIPKISINSLKTPSPKEEQTSPIQSKCRPQPFWKRKPNSPNSNTTHLNADVQTNEQSLKTITNSSKSKSAINFSTDNLFDMLKSDSSVSSCPTKSRKAHSKQSIALKIGSYSSSDSHFETSETFSLDAGVSSMPLISTSPIVEPQQPVLTNVTVSAHKRTDAIEKPNLETSTPFQLNKNNKPQAIGIQNRKIETKKSDADESASASKKYLKQSISCDSEIVDKLPSKKCFDVSKKSQKSIDEHPSKTCLLVSKNIEADESPSTSFNLLSAKKPLKQSLSLCDPKIVDKPASKNSFEISKNVEGAEPPSSPSNPSSSKKHLNQSFSSFDPEIVNEPSSIKCSEISKKVDADVSPSSSVSKKSLKLSFPLCNAKQSQQPIDEQPSKNCIVVSKTVEADESSSSSFNPLSSKTPLNPEIVDKAASENSSEISKKIEGIEPSSSPLNPSFSKKHLNQSLPSCHPEIGNELSPIKCSEISNKVDADVSPSSSVSKKSLKLSFPLCNAKKSQQSIDEQPSKNCNEADESSSSSFNPLSSKTLLKQSLSLCDPEIVDKAASKKSSEISKKIEGIEPSSSSKKHLNQSLPSCDPQIVNEPSSKKCSEISKNVEAGVTASSSVSKKSLKGSFPLCNAKKSKQSIDEQPSKNFIVVSKNVEADELSSSSFNPSSAKKPLKQSLLLCDPEIVDKAASKNSSEISKNVGAVESLSSPSNPSYLKKHLEQSLPSCNPKMVNESSPKKCSEISKKVETDVSPSSSFSKKSLKRSFSVCDSEIVDKSSSRKCVENLFEAPSKKISKKVELDESLSSSYSNPSFSKQYLKRSFPVCDSEIVDKPPSKKRFEIPKKPQQSIDEPQSKKRQKSQQFNFINQSSQSKETTTKPIGPPRSTGTPRPTTTPKSTTTLKSTKSSMPPTKTTAELEQCYARVLELEFALTKFSKVALTYREHTNRKKLEEELENKRKELNKLQTAHKQSEKFKSESKAYSERKPFDIFAHHQEPTSQYINTFQRTNNDTKSHGVKLRPYSERQHCDTSSTRQSIHAEKHEPTRRYVNKFGQLFQKNFDNTNKNEYTAYIDQGVKVLESWGPNQASTEEIIEDFRRSKFKKY